MFLKIKDFLTSQTKKFIKIIVNIRDDKFSNVILFSMVLYIIIGTVYQFSCNHNFHNGIMIWEFSSYTFTLIYTLWFWLISKNGRKILLDVSKTRPLIGLFTFAPVLLLLMLITVFHYLLIWRSDSLGVFITEHSVNITLFLIILVYLCFLIIHFQVKKYSNGDELTKELQITFEYIDKPVLYSFCTLFVYSLYVCVAGDIETMKMFFSGAIAFELLLSGYIWTRTEIA